VLLSIKMAADDESRSITPTIPDEEVGEHDAEQADDTGGGKASNAAGKGAKAGQATAQGGRQKRARSKGTDPNGQQAGNDNTKDDNTDGKKKGKATTVLKKPAMAGVSKKPAGKHGSVSQASTGVAGKPETKQQVAKKPAGSDATVSGAEASNTGRQSGKASTGYQRMMEMSREFQQKRNAAKDIVFCLSMPWFVLIERTYCSCTAASSY
jgi:hypothetical protein